MPQTIPFYFVGQATAVALMFSAIVYAFSVYIMPPLLQLWVTRLYVTKLLVVIPALIPTTVSLAPLPD